MPIETSDKPKQFRGFPDEEISVRVPQKVGLSHGEPVDRSPRDQERQQKGSTDKEVSLPLLSAAEQRHAKAAGTPSKEGAQHIKRSSDENVSRVMPATRVRSHATVGHALAERQLQPKGLANQTGSLLVPVEARKSMARARGKQPRTPATQATLIGDDAGQRKAAQAEHKLEGKRRTHQTALGALKEDVEESMNVAIAKGEPRPEVTMGSGWGRPGAHVLPNVPKTSKAAEQLNQAEQSSFGQASAIDGQMAIKSPREEANLREQGSSWQNALQAAKQHEEAGTNHDGVFEILTHDWDQGLMDKTGELNQDALKSLVIQADGDKLVSCCCGLGTPTCFASVQSQ